jgi:hypothetical protein
MPAMADNNGQKIIIQMLCTSFGLNRYPELAQVKKDI